MCAIVGAFDRSGRRRFEPRTLERMLDAQAHRGPDDRGIHIEPGLALGVARLRVVGGGSGRQPLCNESGSVWCAVNGELYDDQELRADLAQRGHALQGECDASLWPHLYEEHGQALWPRVRGQFAIAVWDRAQRRLTLSRDRFGIHPLYIAEADGWLLWSSEIKGLLASGWIAPSIEPTAITDVLWQFSVGPTRTAFAGIRCLAPATYLAADERGVRERRYYTLSFPPAGSERGGSTEELADALEDHLTRAVRRRLRADRRLAVYLSGGVDSSVVLALAKRVGGDPHAFAIAQRGTGPEEQNAAQDVARYLDVPLHCQPVDRRALGAAYPTATMHAEAPIVDTSTVCLLELATAVRRTGSNAALCGEGADEAFAGYAWYKLAALLRSPGRLGFIARELRGLLFAAIGPDPLHDASTQGCGAWAQELFHAALRRSSARVTSPRPSAHTYEPLPTDLATRTVWSELNQELYVDYHRMLPSLLLATKGDRMSLGASVEARYPFLDEDLVDFCAQLAPQLKLRGGTGKWLLRRVAARWLPKRIAARPKRMLRSSRGAVLLRRDRPPWVDELLSVESLRATGLFDPGEVRRQWRLQRALPALSPLRITMDVTLTAVVGTQLFVHQFMGRSLCGLPRWSPPERR